MRLVVDFFTYVARLGAPARRAPRCQLFAYAAWPGASARRAARRRLLRLRHAFGCLGTSHGSSRGSSHRSSSTTSPTPRVRVPRHVTWLVTRLVVDYFDYAAHLGASARRAARHAAHRAARRRLLHLRCASGCLGTSRGSLSTSSPTPRVRVPRHVARLVVDYFAYTMRLGASAPRTAHRAARRAARRRLLHLSRVYRVPRHVARLVTRFVVDYFAYAGHPGASTCHAARHAARRAARRRLLHIRRASRCPGTSRGSLSTSLPTPRVLVPRHVARLVVDFFAYAAHPGASAPRTAHRAARRVARRRLLRLHRASGCLGTSRGSSRGSSPTTSTKPRIWVPRHVARLVTRLVAPLVVDYFAYAVRPGASARRTAHCRLLRLRRAFGCLGTLHGSLSTTSPTLCV
jgi:hypothetical protein